MEGNAQYHYLMDPSGHPIFISDMAFKVMDKEGTIGRWMKSGMIKGVYSSSEPRFADQYMHKVFPPEKPKAEEPDIPKIITALKEKGKFSGIFGLPIQDYLNDPESHENVVQTLVDQYGDNPKGVKTAIGDEAFKEIEPMLKRAHKIEVKEEKAETEQADNTKKIMDQADEITKDGSELGEKMLSVPDKRNKETGEVTMKDEPAKVVISRLKERHDKLTELIKCLGAA